MLDKPIFNYATGGDQPVEIIELQGLSAEEAISIAQENLIFTADYDREGHDLVILGQDGQQVIIQDYFQGSAPADLVAPNGAVLRGELISVLAGPDNPGVYAQQGDIQGATPIGQVETLEGTATVQRTDGTVEQLQIGTKVFQNDVVQTTDGSTLSITFADKTIFTLSAASRMVLSELVYAPDGDDNSAVFNLIEGSFVFIAGQVAQTGDMKVETPVATMGIRGTTVSVVIETDASGQASVTVSLNRDIDGAIGSIELINNLDGSVTQITATDSSWVINPAVGATTEVPRTADDQADDLVIINEAFEAVRSVETREAAGEQPVNLDDAGDDAPADAGDDQQDDDQDGDDQTEQQDGDQTDGDQTDQTDSDGDNTQETQSQDGDGNADADSSDEGTQESAPQDNAPSDDAGSDAPGDQSNLGSGLDTSAPTDVSSLGNIGGDLGISDLSGGDTAPPLTDTGAGSAPLNEAASDEEESEQNAVNDTNETTDENSDDSIVVEEDTNILPSIELPELTADITEDTSVTLDGFNIGDGSGGSTPLTVTLNAGSTIRLAPGSTVAIDAAASIESPPGSGEYDLLVFTGTPDEVNNALNGAVYTPSENDDDGGTLDVTVSNGTESTTATLTIGIIPVNDAPTLDAVSIDVNEDTPVNIDLAQFSEDVDGDALTYSTPFIASEFFTNGLSIAGSTLTFDPGGEFDSLAAGETTQRSFTLRVEDPERESADNVVTFNITGANDAPVAQSIDISGPEDTAITGQLLATDVDSADLIFAAAPVNASDPASGSVIVESDGSFVYSPSVNFSGTDSFTFSVTDSDGAIDTSTVNITITEVNDAPVNTVPGAVITQEEISTAIGGISIADPDAADSDITVTFSVNNGSVSVEADLPGGVPSSNIDTSNGPNSITITGTVSEINTTLAGIGGVIYDGNTDFVGSDTLTITTTDGELTDIDIVPITVEAVNDAPIITLPDDQSVDEDGSLIINGLSFEDVDAGNADVTVNLSVTNGRLTINDSVVGGLNDVDITNNGLQDVTLTGTISEINTTLSDVAGLLYEPDSNFNGSDNLEITINDNGATGAFGPQTTGRIIQITVNAVDDVPETNNAAATGNEDAASIEVTLTGSDVDGTVDSFRILSLPTNGGLFADAALTIAIDANETVSATSNQASVFFVPFEDSNEDQSFTFAAIDDDGLEDATPATATIMIDAVNDAPFTNDATATGDEDVASIAVTLTGSDVDNAIDAFRILSLPTDGALFSNAALTNAIDVNDLISAISAEATVFFVPNENFNGTQTFTFASVDDAGLEDATPATATITVTSVPDGLTANDDTITLTEDDTANITGNILANDNDPDGGMITLFGADEFLDFGGFGQTNMITFGVPFNLDQGGQITIQANGDFVFDPDGNPNTLGFDFLESGETFIQQIDYTIEDEDAESAFASFFIEITGVNDAPEIIGDLTAIVDEGGSVILNDLVINAEDPDDFGDGLTFTITSGPTNGQVFVNGDASSTFTQNDLFNNLVTFQHNGSQTTSDSFTFSLADGGEDGAGTDMATFNLTVNPVNDAPETNDATAIGNEDAASIAVTLTGSDVDGTVDSFRLASLVNNGNLYRDAGLTDLITLADDLIPASGNQATIFFEPLPNFNGTADFTFAAIDNDGLEDSTPATATITVNSVNDAPFASGSLQSIDEDGGALEVALAGSDIDGTVVSFRISEIPAGGTFFTDNTLTTQLAVNDVIPAVNQAASVFFVPDQDFNSITPLFLRFFATDNEGLESAGSANAAINVNAVNDDPVVDNVPTVTNVQQLLDPNGAAGDEFGFGAVVSADGNTIVVGSRLDDDNGSDSGSIFVYTSDGNGGFNSPIQLTDSNGAASDLFGRSVSVSANGSAIVVGSELNDTNGANSGSASVFTSDGSGGFNGPVQLLNPSPAVDDRFGTSVSISSDGSTIVVGSALDDNNGLNSGSVFVFTSDGSGGFNAPVELLHPDNEVGAEFGNSVSVSSDGNVIAIGSSVGDGAASNTGSVFVFASDGNGGYGDPVELVNPNGLAGDAFGLVTAISADGSTVVVGSEADDDRGANSGSAFVFVNDGNGGFSSPIQLLDPNNAAGDRFGSSVSVSSDGSTVLVGARDDDDSGSNAGSAFIFTRNADGSYGSPVQLQDSNAGAVDRFGSSVSISSNGSLAVVGSLQDDDNGTDSGSAFVFALTDGIVETVAEDSLATTIDLLEGASDVDNPLSDLSVTNVSGLVSGVIFNAGDNTLSVDPSDASFQSLGTGETQTITISFDIIDGDGGSVAQTATINVTGTNDAPILDLDANDSSGAVGTGYNDTFTEGGPAVNISDLDQSDLSISDVDSDTIQSATITLTNNLDGDDEFLVADIGNITALGLTVEGNNTDSITLSGTATISQYEEALENIRYNNLSNTPDTTDRIINVVVNDGEADSNVAVATISVIAQNDAPFVSQIGQQIVLNTTDANDQLGASVAIDNNGNVIAGAPGTNSNGGEVVIATPNATGGFNLDTDTGFGNGTTLDFFGNSVAINDSGRVVIGRQGFDSSIFTGTPLADIGVIEVFDLNASGGLDTVTQLQPSVVSADAGDFIGITVDINNNNVIVAGAVGDDGVSDTLTGAGAAYVYVPTSSVPFELRAPDAQAGDNFGASVSINDAGVVVVGATLGQNDDANSINSGTVYVFTPTTDASGNITSFDSGTELLLRGNSLSTPSNGDNIGAAVAINNAGIIAVGSPNDEFGEGPDSGAVVIFDSPTDTDPQYLLINESSFAGSSLALNDNGVLAIGAPGSNPGADNANSVFIYTQNASGDFVFSQVISAPNDETDSGFGTSVALNNDGTLVVGASLQSNDSGAAAGTFFTFVPDESGNYTLATSGVPVEEGNIGTPDLRTVDLNNVVTFSDTDDTPFIDEASINININTTASIDVTSFFSVNGTEVSYDLALFDFLNDGEAIDVEISFNVISGADSVPRVFEFSIDGVSDGAANIINGTPSNDGEILGSEFDDIIFANGTDAGAFQGDQVFGGDGNDILVGGDGGSELLDGGEGDDTILVGDADSFNGDYVIGSLGNDRIVYSRNINGFHDISYGNFTATMIAIIATVDFTTNTGSIDKVDLDNAGAVVGTDTLVDVSNAIESELGGFQIRGTQRDDIFNVTSSPDGFFGLNGGQGSDTFNLGGGFIRLEFRFAAEGTNQFSGSFEGANVNLSLANNQVINDGFGFTDTINFTGDFSSGSGNSVELRGTDFDDILIGGDGDDRFIGERGNDLIDGGAGIDLIRLDRTGAASVNIDLEASGVNGTGFFDNTIFNYTLLNIEDIRGSNVGVDFLSGNGVSNRIEGRQGIDFINGRGGDDTLIGDSPSGTPDDIDVFIFDPFNGNDVIEGFVIGQDRISIVDSSIGNGVGTGGFDTFMFDGQDTLIELDGGASSITVQGVDLTTANPDDVFVFDQVSQQLGTNEFTGGDANELLIGTSGDDTISGGAGNDIIIAGGATDGTLANNTFFVDGEVVSGDLIDGGAGDDLIIVQSGSSDVIGGEGNDRIQSSRTIYVSDEVSFPDFLQVNYASSTSGITANLTSVERNGLQSQQVNDGLGGIDTLGGVTRIRDSQFDDVFFIDGSDPATSGSRGADVSLTGGNDTVTFLGNGGRLDFAAAGDGVRVDLGAGTAIDNDLSNGDQQGNDTFTGATQVNGSRFDDVIIGNDQDNRLRGRDGNDTIDGGGGNNTVDHFSSINRVSVDLSQGLTLDDGQGGRDTLINIQNAYGNHGTDFIIGDSGDNRLFGFASADVLVGDDGDDTLTGDFGDVGRGNGVFTPGGDDLLIGESGNDTLEGGVGADLFLIDDIIIESLTGTETQAEFDALAAAESDGFDFIVDFNLAEGDRIGLTDPSITSIDLGRISFNAEFNNFFVGFGDIGISFDERVDLSGITQAEIDSFFIFNIQSQDDSDLQNFTGTAGDDYVFVRPTGLTGANDAFVYLQGTAGNDTYDFTAGYDDFQILSYRGFTTGITADIDIINNTGTVDKGALGTDTLRNVSTPAIAGGLTFTGGFDIRGGDVGDVFNITTDTDTFVNAQGRAGVDTYNIDNSAQGFARIDLRGGFTGVNVDLSLGSGQIIDDGFGNTETVNFTAGTGALTNTGAVDGVFGAELQIRGTDFDDVIVGGAGNESLITEQGNDSFDGGAGFDRIRYDRDRAVSADVDLENQQATGFFDDTAFTHTLINIEHVDGSAVGVDILRGTNAFGETLEGNAGVDILDGRGGNDFLRGDMSSSSTLPGEADQDVFVIGNASGAASAGQDVIADFTLGQDRIFAVGGFSNVSDFNDVGFDGANTIIDLDGTNTVTINNFDLTALSEAEQNEIFVFNAITPPNGDTTFNGSAGNDFIQGTGGDDNINGGAGNDIILSGDASSGYFTFESIDGGAGDDLIIQQGGFSNIIGGAGDDRIQGTNLVFVTDEISFSDFFTVDYGTSTSGITVNYTGETRLGLEAQQVDDGLGGTDTLGGISNITDSAFDDTFFVDDSDNTIRGSGGPRIFLSGGNDEVTFLDGNGEIDFARANDGVIASLATGTASDRNVVDEFTDDIGSDTFTGAVRLHGSAFDDVLTGSDGDERFRGRAGNDEIDGSGGIDRLDYFDAVNRVVVDLADTDGNGFQADEDSFGNQDILINIENISTNLGADIVFGDANNNRLDGFSNSDVLFGGAGDDELNGDFGNVGLAADGIALGGNDYLDGGAGNDVLTGGVGADIFAFQIGGETVASGPDFITDLNFAEGDRIDISSFGLTSSSQFFDVGFSAEFNATFFNFGTDFNGDAEGFSASGDFSGLTTAELDEVFIFNVSSNATPTDTISGFDDEDDYIRVNSRQTALNAGNVTVNASAGADTIDLTFAFETFVSLDYSAQGAVNFDIDTETNISTVTKGNGDVDELYNLTVSAQGGFATDTGGFELIGGVSSDTFNITNADNAFISLFGGDGVDTFNLENADNGFVQLDVSSGTSGATVDLSTNAIINDGFGNTDTITGPGQFDAVFGSAFADNITGSDNDERIIGGGAADTLLGGDGDDTIAVPDLGFDLVDGGTGIDTLEIVGGGQVLDFTNLGTDEINSLERLSLGTEDGVTEVTLDDQNVINFSETFDQFVNSLDDDPAGDGGNPLVQSTDVLLVTGDSDDTLTLLDTDGSGGASWQLTGTDNGFEVYNFTDGVSTFASVAVAEEVVVETPVA